MYRIPLNIGNRVDIVLVLSSLSSVIKGPVERFWPPKEKLWTPKENSGFIKMELEGKISKLFVLWIILY